MSEFVDRRDFMKHAGVAALGFGFAAHAAGANENLRVAVAGTNGRGQALIECFTHVPGVEVAYIADPEDGALAKGMKATLKKQRLEPQGVRDFRRALDDKTVGAIAIAAPDHWHAPMAIMALAAGKHVYLEKPCAHNPYEGELLIKAVQRHKRVFQMGAQRRSFPNIQQAVKEIRGGAIGKAYFGRAWYVNNRAPIGRGKAVAAPSTLDYNLWQGPAPRRDFRDNVVHYNWHWFWNWGTGEALNNGTHEVDVCRWALGVDWPVRVTSSGGRYHFQDDWETPDTQVIGLDYAEGKTISWEGRSCNDYPVEGLARGAMVHGTEGAALLDGNSYIIYDKKNKVVKQVKEEAAVDRTNTLSATGFALDLLHVQNFVDAIRKGTPTNCPVDEAHKSVASLLIGNIAQRVGRTLHLDASNGHIKNDAEAMKLWRRDYESGWEPSV